MILNQEIIKRFLKNESTHQESEAVESWYFSFEKNLDGIGQMLDAEQIELENEVYLKIKRRIQSSEVISKTPIFWHSYVWRAAAVLLVFFGILVYYKTQKYTQTNAELSGWVKFENISAKDLKIILPDGSRVVMKPETQLTYNQLDKYIREVNLTGEAFFDVRRDESRPFFVYTGKLTTKVLGTSFSIKSYPDVKRAEVAVLSGKVTVYEKDVEGQKDNGVVLTPNLKVTYFEKEAHFVSGIVEKPEVIQTIKKESFSFNFQNTPLADVLKILEKTYGIEMVLDHETLGRCTLTGHLEEMPLFDKLDIIARSLNATYEIKGTSILVSGKGCE